MIESSPSTPSQRSSGRKSSSRQLFWQLGPALALIILLFGGGLFLGILQALGHLPSIGIDQLSLKHFHHVFVDPDFIPSFKLTIYISAASTVIAALLSLLVSLSILRLAPKSKLVNYFLQIPLTVPHLVVAISVLLLLSPAGFFSRLLHALSIIDSPSIFPLLVNDRWCIGILTVYVWKEVPFISFMLLSVLKNMGPELLEVGATLKANWLQKFLFIILPLIAPSLGSACLIVFAYTFGSFEVPYLLGQTYPMTLSVWAYKSYSDIDLLARPEGIAIGLLLALFIIGFIALSHFLLHFSGKDKRLS